MSIDRVVCRITIFLVASVAMISSLAVTGAASDGGPSPVSGVSLTATPPSPQPSGTPVIFTAAASGGSGIYEYMFWGRLAGAPTWSPVQSYGTSNSWTWSTAGVFLGTYEVKVDARSLGSTAASEATQTITYVVTVPPDGGSR